MCSVKVEFSASVDMHCLSPRNPWCTTHFSFHLSAQSIIDQAAFQPHFHLLVLYFLISPETEEGPEYGDSVWLYRQDGEHISCSTVSEVSIGVVHSNLLKYYVLMCQILCVSCM